MKKEEKRKKGKGKRKGGKKGRKRGKKERKRGKKEEKKKEKRGKLQENLTYPPPQTPPTSLEKREKINLNIYLVGKKINFW